MLTKPISRLVFTSLFSISALAATSVLADEVFQENFDYVYPEQLTAAWEAMATAGGRPLSIGTEEFVDTVPYAVVGNVIIMAPLGQTLTSDWTLSFDMLHKDAARGAWVGLFDDEGLNGYAATWSSGPPNTEGKSTGGVSIAVINGLEGSEKDAWRTFGKSITKTKGSGHISTTAPLAHFVLTWKADTGLLTLSVDGKQISTATDTSIKEFSKIAIKGNGYVYVDNISVTSGE